LLHDVGALVLGTRLPEQFRSVRAAREELKRPLHELEAERLGVSHAEIGAYLLGIWGFPYPIVEAVANHHVPWRVPHERFGLVDIVYVASTLAVEQEQPPAAGASCSPGLDLSYLETLGVADSVSTWRAMAAELVSGSGAG
jgi:HD-like signal output (HDOD) protein